MGSKDNTQCVGKQGQYMYVWVIDGNTSVGKQGQYMMCG